MFKFQWRSSCQLKAKIKVRLTKIKISQSSDNIFGRGFFLTKGIDLLHPHSKFHTNWITGKQKRTGKKLAIPPSGQYFNNHLHILSLDPRAVVPDPGKTRGGGNHNPGPEVFGRSGKQEGLIIRGGNQRISVDLVWLEIPDTTLYMFTERCSATFTLMVPIFRYKFVSGIFHTQGQATGLLPTQNNCILDLRYF